MSLWQLLFLQCFGSAFVLPLASPAIYFGMIGFGGYDLKQATALALAAVMSAQAMNFAFGWGLRELRRRGQIFMRDDIYRRGQKLSNTWLLPLLLFTWVGMGPLLAVLAGFFGVPVKKAFPLMLFGWAGYYGYAICFR